jgi:hypothetical protein
LINGSIKTSGTDNQYIKQSLGTGIYTIKANSFVCTIGSANCEPDRYEINFSRRINNIYGIGRQTDTGEAELTLFNKGNGTEEFLDTSFSTGHLIKPDGIGRYVGDPARMKTPLVVIPEENLIIAYLQPAVKMLRVSRTASSTTIVMKKHHLYNEGAPGKLLVVKGQNLFDMYKKYNDALKNEGFFFKKPARNAFGVNWETVGEFATSAPINGGATVYGLRQVVDKYTNAGISLSSMTFGSGYWIQDNSKQDLWGYSGIYQRPTIDTLKLKEESLKTFFNELNTKNIYPIIGVRQHASWNPGNTLNINGVDNVTNKFKAIGISNPFVAGDYTQAGYTWYPWVKMINVENPTIAGGYVTLLKNAYGNFRGVKEDEMISYDVKGEKNNPKATNLWDGFVSKMYKTYAGNNTGDFISLGSNDWFGVGTDGQVFGAVVEAVPTAKSTGNYLMKYYLDSALSQVASGYPHPMVGYNSEDDFKDITRPTNCIDATKNTGDEAKRIADFNANCKIPAANVENFLRGNQINTFSPIYMSSRGFWHLSNPTDQQNYIFYAKLRERLQQYAYDGAMQWYNDGVSHLMMPLWMVAPKDPEVYKLYEKLAASDTTSPKNEYMFGDALLVRPIYRNGAKTVRVYFPAGASYIPFLKNNGETIQGGRYYDYTLSGPLDYSVFLKERQLLIINDANDKNKQLAYFFTGSGNETAIYTYNKPQGGTARLQGIKRGNSYVIRNLDNGKEVTTTKHETKNFQQAIINSLF